MNYLYYQFWTKESLSCHISNQNPWICLIAKYCEIMKMPTFGTKNALFWYFWARILKNYCHIWNHRPQICLSAKFHEKNKNAWFGYFWAGIWKQFCHIWNQYLRICLIAKFGGKTKMPKFGNKNALFGYFWPKMPYLDIFVQKCLIWIFLGKNFKNTIVIFEISTLKFV